MDGYTYYVFILIKSILSDVWHFLQASKYKQVGIYWRLEPQRTRRRQAVLLKIRDQIYGDSVKVSTSEFFLGFIVVQRTTTIPTLRAEDSRRGQIRIQSPLQFRAKQFNHPI